MQNDDRRSRRDPYHPSTVDDGRNDRYGRERGPLDQGVGYRQGEQQFEPSPLFQPGQHRLNQFERSSEAHSPGESGGRSRGARPGGYGAPRTFPKGYKRSDERIRDDICETLSRSGTDVSDVSVEVSGGRVILEGTVIDRYAKHEIEDHAAECLGVEDVENRIRVER
jgi:osmotically-inducible protein OsmY